jgi:hypothetical protein
MTTSCTINGAEITRRQWMIQFTANHVVILMITHINVFV